MTPNQVQFTLDEIQNFKTQSDTEMECGFLNVRLECDKEILCRSIYFNTRETKTANFSCFFWILWLLRLLNLVQHWP